MPPGLRQRHDVGFEVDVRALLTHDAAAAEMDAVEHVAAIRMLAAERGIADEQHARRSADADARESAVDDALRRQARDRRWLSSPAVGKK